MYAHRTSLFFNLPMLCVGQLFLNILRNSLGSRNTR
uniref:Uncharacterized protein n=1 Tax=Tetraselmis sp. GSL018 TaxID=582737 RepID=A0A061S539_9CHLO